MSTPAGHIELERAVDSIIVGRRHRTDLGDLDALAVSIDREGLLQPPTITPDGVLVCGRRRLAAIQQLRWRTVNVWVRSGISDRLGQLMAEQDDNMLHKPLTQLEAAGLYRELKQVMAEDAARRKAATQFSVEHQPGGDGPANLAGPSTPLGEARAQAARMVTGRASYTTLEKIGHLQALAADPTQPDQLRQHVTAELARIEDGAPVNPIYEALRETIQATSDARDADLDALAEQALARTQHTTGKRRAHHHHAPSTEGNAAARYPVRAFVVTWGELENWWEHYDIDELATALTDEQVKSFLHTAQGTSTFADHLCAARAATGTGTDSDVGSVEVASARGHLRAL
ncbi:MAG: ParB N-terminal domain-containing protein [Nocardioides sp.]|uniref:ParB N-terminal domain-containing protein n=1 Tax=Nocardioides sp. TaxID=35761 RepID=UPI0039E223E1